MAQVARVRAIALLSGQVAGVRRLYGYLAILTDPEGYATLNPTALSEQWGRPRTTLIYWYEKLCRLRLLQEVDLAGDVAAHRNMVRLRMGGIKLNKWCIAAAAIFGLLLVNFPAVGQDAHAEGFWDGLARGAVDAPYVAAFLFGLVGGPFYLLYTLFTEPTVPPEVLVAIQDKPREYQMGYLEGYKSAKQMVRVIGGLIGTAAWWFVARLAAEPAEPYDYYYYYYYY